MGFPLSAGKVSGKMTQEKSKNEFSGAEKAVIKRKKGISPIWILPIVAVLIGIWLLYKGIVEAPIKVVINFETAEGITAGKTKVLYKGFKTGVVRSVQISPDFKSVDVAVDFDRSAEGLLVSDTEFWLVKPRVSLEGITGLGTLVAGDHIAMRPGDDHGRPTRKYRALAAPPAILENAPGLHLTLISKDLASVQVGSPVYYKRITVGDVQSYKLLEDEQQIAIRIYIHPQYSQLVNEHTRFWNASGIEVDGSLSGFKIRTQSFTSMLMGGIAFDTPETASGGRRAKNGDQFGLFHDFQAAEAGTSIRIRFATAEGLVEGQTKVMFKGITVGYVKRLIPLPDLLHLDAEVTIHPRAERFLLSDTQFWLAEPKLSLKGVTNLESLVKGNFIQMQVTGKGRPQRQFNALKQAPAPIILAPGLRIKAVTNDIGSIDIGTPVYYKKVVVGQVQRWQLDQKTDAIHIHIFIKEEFQHLVKTTSRFWNASGIYFSAGLAGVKIRTESLASMLDSGIAFYTPDTGHAAPPAAGGQLYQLYADYESAHRAGVPIKITFDRAEGLREGSKIKYRGLEIGAVDAIVFGRSLNEVMVSAHLDSHARVLAREGTQFWVAKAEIGVGGVSHLSSLITGSYIAVRPAETSGDRAFIASGDSMHPNQHDPRIPMIRKRLSIVGDLKSSDLDPNLYDEDLAAAVKKFQAQHGLTVDGIIGPGTIAALNGLVGAGGSPKFEFSGLSVPPFAKENGAGLAIQLVADQLGAVKEGDQVYYRKVVVGRIRGYELSGAGDQVIIHADIAPHYAHLVRKNSRFWNAGGIDIHGGLLSGGAIDIESLQSLLTGGIAFYTPEHEPNGRPAGHGETFTLFADLQSAQQAKIAGKPDLKVILRAAGLGSVTKKDNVFYRELVVGKVTGYELAATADHVLIFVEIDQRFAPLVREKSVFWNASGIDVHFGLFSGAEIHTESLQSILAGGIAFATPNEDKMGERASENTTFDLYPKVKEEWLKWAPKIELAPTSKNQPKAVR
jgi:paraquat-inducible protein B